MSADSSRGPLKAHAAGVTSSPAIVYFVGALQYFIDEQGTITADDWNQCIETARELAAETPIDGA